MSENPASVQQLALLQRLSALFPEFVQQWHGPDNYHLEDDGEFTLCGVFAEFTNFTRDHPQEFTSESLSGLAAILAECMNGTDPALDEAAASCFLENIAGEPISDRLKPFLSGEPLRFLSQFTD